MGIGLVFWGVAEPLNHFVAPPPGAAADTPAQAARTAMDTTFLHWGLHAWATYVVVGLAIAYSVHRRGNPISIRWALRPLLGDRLQGFWGDVIDVVAVLSTLFGVATSLGLGVSPSVPVSPTSRSSTSRRPGCSSPW
ncbi:BCCT family transporter [Nocardioides sp. zg-ZUI104]|nr:BCCT family transporter [Nocardioides faecalis]